jgi:hypothetical protein
MDASHYGYIKVYPVGARVEFSPGMDIWMRGAKFGRITSRKLICMRNIGRGEAWLYWVAPEFCGKELDFRIKVKSDDLRYADHKGVK